MTKIKHMLTIFFVVALVVIAGCSSQEPMETEYETGTDMGDFETDIIIDEQPAATGNVVAVVNGEEITETDISQASQSFQQEVSREQLIELVINQKLLEQQVELLSMQEAQALFEAELAMQGATLEDYQAQVEMMGLNYEEHMQDIQLSISIQNYLENNIEIEEVTAQEVQELYEAYSFQIPEDELPSFEELEDELYMFVEQQKQEEAIGLLIEQLRSTAVVEYR